MNIFNNTLTYYFQNKDPINRCWDQKLEYRQSRYKDLENVLEFWHKESSSRQQKALRQLLFKNTLLDYKQFSHQVIFCVTLHIEDTDSWLRTALVVSISSFMGYKNT